MYLTAKKNNIDIAKLLIERGADINDKSKCYLPACMLSSRV